MLPPGGLHWLFHNAWVFSDLPARAARARKLQGLKRVG